MGHLQPLHLPKAQACLLVLPTVEMGRQAAILALQEVTPAPATGHKGFSLPSLSVALSAPISASMFRAPSPSNFTSQHSSLCASPG